MPMNMNDQNALYALFSFINAFIDYYWTGKQPRFI